MLSLTVDEPRCVAAKVLDDLPEGVEAHKGHDGDPDQEPWVEGALPEPDKDCQECEDDGEVKADRA